MFWVLGFMLSALRQCNVFEPKAVPIMFYVLGVMFYVAMRTSGSVLSEATVFARWGSLAVQPPQCNYANGVVSLLT